MPDSTPSSGPVRKVIKATREIKAIIKGIEYDVLLIPEDAMLEVDFSQFPEDDPLRRHENVRTMTEVDLDPLYDIKERSDLGRRVCRLTEDGAKKLLGSL